MRSRKKEIEQLVQLLESEADSVEDLADSVWKMLDSFRRDREAWVVGVRHEPPLILMYGLYDTENAALKDVTKYRSMTGGETAFVFKLVSPSKMFEIEQIDFR